MLESTVPKRSVSLRFAKHTLTAIGAVMPGPRPVALHTVPASAFSLTAGLSVCIRPQPCAFGSPPTRAHLWLASLRTPPPRRRPLQVPRNLGPASHPLHLPPESEGPKKPKGLTSAPGSSEPVALVAHAVDHSCQSIQGFVKAYVDLWSC